MDGGGTNRVRRYGDKTNVKKTEKNLDQLRFIGVYRSFALLEDKIEAAGMIITSWYQRSY